MIDVPQEKRKWTVSPARAARYESERQQIIRTAYRLMARGQGTVSIQDILDSAALSTRAFYRHFASKNDLFLAMYRNDNQRLAHALSEATMAEPDAWRALQAWVELSLAVAYEPDRLRHSRVLSSAEVQHAEGYKRELLDGKDRSRASLEALLLRGGLDGTFQTVQAREDALVIFGATSEFVSIRLEGGEEALNQKQALDAILGAAARLLGVPAQGAVTRRRKRPARSSATSVR
jgi:AcrR family transcriptional regulator